MTIRYNQEHTYTKEEAHSIVNSLQRAEQKEGEANRFTFILSCVGEDCYKVAIYDADKQFRHYL